MTKFEKFSEFIYEGIIYILVTAFIVTLIPMGSFLVLGSEWLWAIWLAFITYAITGVWLIMLVICLLANKIIRHLVLEPYEINLGEDDFCDSCDYCEVVDSPFKCATCNNGNNYSNIIIKEMKCEE